MTDPMTEEATLWDYCQTEHQQEVLEAYLKHGSGNAAGKALGLSGRNVRNIIQRIRAYAARKGHAPDHDLHKTVPDGYMVKGTSTYYDKEGKVRGQWVKSQVDRERQFELLREAIQSLAEDIIPAVRMDTTDPMRPYSNNLLSVYPVGDYHLGMLSWAKETGGNWDMNIAENMMNDAIGHLMDQQGPFMAETALIPLLGDFFHYDSMVPETPTSRNQLDSDTRPQKMIRAGLRVAIMMVEQARFRHKNVHVIVEIGNHDLTNSVWLAEALRIRYEGCDDVYIDTSPAHFHYYRFGKNLIATHHGHGVKMDQLPIIMAQDRAKDWGETEYRYWYTGHIHNAKSFKTALTAQDFVGCSVESFRILAPEDAYAANKGYRSVRDMKAILIDAEYGEVGRNTFNPRMMEGMQ